MTKKLFLLPLMAFLLVGCNKPTGGGGQGGGEGGGGGGGGEPQPTLVAKYDFSSLTKKGEEIKTADAMKTVFAGALASGGTNIVSNVSTITKVYEGNSNGGIGAAAGLLKFGTGSANGVLEFTLTQEVKKVVLNCHSFYKSSAEYPNNTTNYVAVNSGTAVAAPYNETAAGEDVEFAVTGTTVKIETSNPAPTSTTTAGRIVVYSIALYA